MSKQSRNYNNNEILIKEFIFEESNNIKYSYLKNRINRSEGFTPLRGYFFLGAGARMGGGRFGWFASRRRQSWDGGVNEGNG